MGVSDYLETEIINASLRGTTLTAYTNTFVALYTASPADDASGTGAEIAGGNYARATVAGASGSWDAPSGGGTTANTADITFPAPSAQWGTVSHFGILDATAAGNLLYHGTLAADKLVDNGDPAPKFPAGDLDITLD